MKKRFLPVLVSLFILMTGCNQKGQMGDESVENAITNMTKNESIQKAFSDGRLHVMNKDLQIKRSILQNTMNEQNMMMEDPELSKEFLRLNINTNRMMMKSPSGKEQLTQSTLTVLEGIHKDLNKLRSFTQIQNESRKKAINDEKLRNLILQQNVHEQSLALSHPATSRDIKELSLRTTNAILNDSTLKASLLKQNIQAFSAISATPVLRSEMADAMLPLLKDPKIAAELEKMIKLAVAKEAQNMQAQMQAKMQMLWNIQLQQLQQQKMSHQTNNPSKSDSGSSNGVNSKEATD